jgi:acyl dehydratase
LSEDSVITDEMRAAIGVESEPGVWPIELGAIKKFANAIGDSSVLYTDEVAARQSPAGGIIAPPTFLRLLSPGAHKATYKMPYREVLDGGSEYEYFAPIRVGDTITSTVTLVDVFEKPGRLGLMLFRLNETRYVNQFGQLVATQRSTSINYPDQE